MKRTQAVTWAAIGVVCCLIALPSPLALVAPVEAGPFRRYPSGTGRSSHDVADQSQKDVKPSSDRDGVGGEKLPPKPPPEPGEGRRSDAESGAAKPGASTRPPRRTASRDEPPFDADGKGARKDAEDEKEDGEKKDKEEEDEDDDKEPPYDGLFPTLHDRGIALELVYTGETMGLWRGGFNTNRGQRYRGNIDVVLTADLEKLGVGQGVFFLYGQNGHGRGLTERNLGDVQTLSNIDAHDFTQISECWWEGTLCEKLRLRVGQQDCNVDFNVVDLGGDFIHSSFGFSPTIPMPTFPYNSMAAALFFDVTEDFTIKAGVWDGVLPADTWWRNNTDKPFYIAEVKHKYKLRDLQGDWHVGGWIHTAPWENLGYTGAPDEDERFNKSYGYYGGFDQMLWRESNEPENEQGLGVFGQYGWAPQDRSGVRQYVGGGLSYKGLIPRRDADVTGVGVASAQFSKYEADVSSESYLEIFHKWKFSDRVTLQPDVQFIRRPGGQLRNAVAGGLRFEIALH